MKNTNKATMVVLFVFFLICLSPILLTITLANPVLHTIALDCTVCPAYKSHLFPKMLACTLHIEASINVFHSFIQTPSSREKSKLKLKIIFKNRQPFYKLAMIIKCRTNSYIEV